MGVAMLVLLRVWWALRLLVAVAAVWCLGELALTLRAHRAATRLLAAEGAAAMRSAAESVDAAAQGVVAVADRRSGQAIGVMDRRLAGVSRDTRAAVADLTSVLDSRLGAANGSVELAASSFAQTNRELTGALADARTAARRLDYWTDCTNNGLCWQGAITDTLLSVRRAALRVDGAVPQIVSAAEGASRGVQDTAAASAMTAQNLAAITRPAPRWARYVGLGLGIAAPAAVTVLPFVRAK